jgi:predicted enzyme related to lactoylglutathione lyase
MPSDAFDALRQPSSPSRPNPQFAVALRRRILEELGMSTTETITDATTEPVLGQVGNFRIRVNDPDRANAFFGQLFGWESEPYHDERYTDHHVVNTSIHTVLTNEPDAPPVRLFFRVDDAAAMADRIQALGGRIVSSGLTDHGGGWAYAEDDQGTPIGVFRPRDYGPPSGAPVTGEVGYLTINVADTARGEVFYGGVLGWQFNPPRPNAYRHVTNTDLALGVAQGDAGQPGRVVLYFRVEDINAAAARVRELGGQAEDVAESASGGNTLATTDEGTEFYLWQPAPGY